VRQTIRALGWAIRILWIIALLLPLTVGISLWSISNPKSIGFQEPVVSFSNKTFSFFVPFHINYTGLYDLIDIGMTVFVRKGNKIIAPSPFSIPLPNIPAGQLSNLNYSISFNLTEMAEKNRELLTEDTGLNLTVSLRFRIAYVIAFEVSTNVMWWWGAPFYNLTVSEARYNVTSQTFSGLVDFENHAQFTTNGTMLFEIYNNQSELIGSGEKFLSVASGESFHEFFESTIDPSKVTPNIVIRVYFEDVEILEKEWILSE